MGRENEIEISWMKLKFHEWNWNLLNEIEIMNEIEISWKWKWQRAEKIKLILKYSEKYFIFQQKQDLRLFPLSPMYWRLNLYKI